MPAPTAIQRAPEEPLQDDDQQIVDMQDLDQAPATITLDPTALAPSDPNFTLPSSPTTTSMEIDPESRPHFAPASSSTTPTPSTSRDVRKIRIQPRSMSPLKNAWIDIHKILIDNLALQVKMVPADKMVLLRTSSKTTDTGALQKGEDFLKALSLGFDLADAVVLVKRDDMYVTSFEIKDVKTVQGDHKSRAIGRIAGKDGKTKFAIENALHTRLVIAGPTIHILGSDKDIREATRAVCDLIMGAPPGKVYNHLRASASRRKQRM